MAKTLTQSIGVTYESLSKAIQGQIKALRKPVTDLAAKFGVVRESLKETAPKVMRLFNQIKAEHDNFTFVEFARLFDQSIPTHGPDREGIIGYRNHKVYYTLDYMRRLGNLRPRGKQGVRDSATDALARTIATLLSVVPDAGTVWQAVQTEFSFNERIMTRLQKRVASTQPLFKLNVPQNAHIKVGNVIHMEPTRASEGTTPQGSRPAIAAGQRIGRNQRRQMSAAQPMAQAG